MKKRHADFTEDSHEVEKSGRFMSRGDGRRNYTTPYYHIPPYMRNEEDMEYYRDMDRNMGKMYYSDGKEGNASNSGSENSGSYGDMTGGRRGYGKTRFNDGTSTDTRWQKEITQKLKNFTKEIPQKTNK